MKKKNIIVTIIIIVTVALLVAGGIIVYQNYANKKRILTSFTELKSALVETFNIKEEKTSSPLKSTTTGKSSLYINPLFGNSIYGTDIIIENLNNTILNYEYCIDTDSKKMYLDASLLLNDEVISGINFYQTEDISYIFLKNIFDKYIMIDDNDFFSSLEENNDVYDDISYIYDKMIETLINNINSHDIKVSSENNLKKVSLELDNERLTELSNIMIEDLQNDEKAKEILGTSLDDITTIYNDSKNNSVNNEINSIYYNIYLKGNDIVTYQLGIDNNSNNYNIEFNNNDEKSFVINSDNIEVFKATIEENSNMTTINLSNYGNDLGEIIINDNSISYNFTDTSTNIKYNASITSTKDDNLTTTTFEINMSDSINTINVFTLTDIRETKENEANFSNIDTTNSIDINSLTETDISTIETNLMTVIYNIMGIAT